MLTANPWVVYVSVMTPLLSAYYVVVGFIFYRQDVKEKIRQWRNPPVRAAEIPDAPKQATTKESEKPPQPKSPQETTNEIKSEEDDAEEPWNNEGMMSQMEELSLHLKQAVEEAHQKQYSKEEFILLAQMTFKEYPAIYGTPFQLSVNHLIEAELAKYGSIHLSSDDRLRMWNQVD